MGDQGTRGLESNTTRRESVSRPNYHEDQNMQQATEQQAPTAETEDQTSSNCPKTLPQLSTPPSTSTPTIENRNALSRSTSSRSATTNETSSTDYFTVRRSRPLEPPVTKSTLSELDVNKIVHNPKLRHDINFDPELHFRPNLDGEKGRRKQEKAHHFWDALTSQLNLFMGDRDEFMAQYGQGRDWCLPMLLRSVKEIIQTLVPSRDRAYLDEGLNVDLVMQQFARGMADLERLASWLSGVLKSHCAPMRDEWVDDMYNQLTNGNRTNNIEELVKGMRSLLSVLEAMKLDVANHQIRCLRPVLIEETVAFEDKFFRRKIREGKLDAAPAKAWYATMSRNLVHDPASRQSFGEMATFFEAVANMIMPSNGDRLPNTFLFDEERMYKLRSDVLDAINLEICMRLYDQLDREFQSIDSNSVGSIPREAALRLSLSFDDEANTAYDFNAPSSNRSSLVFSVAGSANSSPRSSLICSVQPNVTRPEDRKAKARDLYASLVALLNSCPATSQPGQRWKSMKDSLALQIFRFTNAPAHVLMNFEDSIDQHLSEPTSELFKEVEQDVHRRLLMELQQRVKDFRGLGAVSLFSVATGGRLQSNNRTWQGQPERGSRDRSLESRDDGSLADMATRLAHLGILHWRVWAPLVYLNEDVDTEMS